MRRLSPHEFVPLRHPCFSVVHDLRDDDLLRAELAPAIAPSEHPAARSAPTPRLENPPAHNALRRGYADHLCVDPRRASFPSSLVRRRFKLDGTRPPLFLANDAPREGIGAPVLPDRPRIRG